MNKLFNPKPDPRCVYCSRGKYLAPGEIACPLRGIVEAYDHCGSFSYDPLRRVPPKPVRMRRDYSDEDFRL